MDQTSECPKCFAAGEIMEAKKDKGFEYKKCSLCQGRGIVPNDVADDFQFSITEDNFEEDE